MYKLNNVKEEQQSLFTKESDWSYFQKRSIQNSWVQFYHDVIFPSINEETFSVLYSDNKASRPNTPVNILISLLILKSIKGETDEEVIQDLLFDQRTQYALHTLNDDKQRISKNMLENFRRKLRLYEDKAGIDLFKIEMERLNEKIIELSEIDQSIQREDSMMISAACKRMSRIELVYTTNYLLIKLLNSKGKDIEEYKVYLEEGNKNDTIYRTRDVESESKLDMLLKQSISLYDTYEDDKEINRTQEFLNLKRLIADQYDKNDNKPKKGKEIKSTSLQTPYDPDATYRKKYGDNIGYVANFTEVVDTKGDKNKVLIKSWELDQNVVSDKEFLEREIKKKKSSNDMTEVTKITDGAYYSEELKKKAEDVNIHLHPTELVGKKGKETNLSQFKIDEENHQILECPNKQKPISNQYNEESKIITAKFDRSTCVNCPHRDKCPIIEQKKANTVRTTERAIDIAKNKEERKSEWYQEISNIRAGVEGIPSLLRRRYHIDTRSSRGKSALNLILSTSMMAINIKRASKMGLGNEILGKLKKLYQFLYQTQSLTFKCWN